MSEMLEVEVTPTCISSGYCRNSMPDVFGATPDRKSYVKSNPVPDSAELREAFDNCPVEAIHARSAATGETVFP